jgi:hypothetical protein
MEHFGHDHSCAALENELHIDSHNNDCLHLHYFKKVPTIEFKTEFEQIITGSFSNTIWIIHDQFNFKQLNNLTSRAPPYNML